MPLERILEPEVMDTPEEARDYDAMDHSDVNRQFVEDFLVSGFTGNDILDLGTGTAQIPIALCQRAPHVRVMAADAAVNMLERARLNIEKANLMQRIELQQIDAKALPCRDAMFDAVMSNSIIHHIPEPAACIGEAVRVVRPGGVLFFRDLLRPDSLADLQHLVDTYTGDESEHAQKMFSESLHAALDLNEIRDLVGEFGFAPETVQQTTDRHWTWQATRVD